MVVQVDKQHHRGGGEVTALVAASTKASSTATSSMEGRFTAKCEQSVIPGEGTDVDREVIAVVGAGGNGSTR